MGALFYDEHTRRKRVIVRLIIKMGSLPFLTFFRQRSKVTLTLIIS